MDVHEVGDHRRACGLNCFFVAAAAQQKNGSSNAENGGNGGESAGNSGKLVGNGSQNSLRVGWSRVDTALV